MLVHALLSRSTAHAVQEIEEIHTLAQVSTRDRDYAGTLSELTALSQPTPHVLLVAIDAGPPEAIVAGLRQYRVRQPDVRIILLAPGRTPGDPLISTLVGLSIYDILTEEGPELPSAVRAALDRSPASYAQAARWHSPTLPGTTESSPREAPQEPAVVRVMAARDRPLLIAVAGATRSAGATALSLELSEELAQRGLSVTLLADMTPAEAAIVAASQPPGLTLTLRPLPSDDKQSRLVVAFDYADRADLVIMDLGYLRQAAESDPQTLTVVDHLLIVWPYPRYRLLSATSSLLALTGPAEHLNRVVRQALSRAVHLAYLCPPAQKADAAQMVRAALAELLPPAPSPSIIIPAPLGSKAVDLEPLLAHLAPPARDRRGRFVPLRGRSLIAAMRHASGLPSAVDTAAPPIAATSLRLLSWLPVLGLLWLVAGLLHLAGVSIPSWLYPDLAASLWRTVLN